MRMFLNANRIDEVNELYYSLPENFIVTGGDLVFKNISALYNIFSENMLYNGDELMDLIIKFINQSLSIFRVIHIVNYLNTMYVEISDFRKNILLKNIEEQEKFEIIDDIIYNLIYIVAKTTDDYISLRIDKNENKKIRLLNHCNRYCLYRILKHDFNSLLLYKK